MTALVMVVPFLIAIPMRDEINRGTSVRSLYADLLSFKMSGDVFSSASGSCSQPRYFGKRGSAHTRLVPGIWLIAIVISTLIEHYKLDNSYN
ncbi:hypothetical protein [Paraburkholderia diazotrophica]|uniref:hypothetical protein n=1 Tax=Paraburkholderia diazotrophica TaxID=667676 RepID=UPI0031780C37